MKVRMWQLEMSFVALVLTAVVCWATDGGYLEWIGSGAVLLSFGHAQVADRLAEREAKRALAIDGDNQVTESVYCHAWATRYLVGKESLWCVYFVLHHSWSALAGVGLFLAYPLWRKYYRSGRSPF